LHPCGPINQLRRFIRDRCLGGKEFTIVEAPLRGCATEGLSLPPQQAFSDATVTYSDTDRLLGLNEARAADEIQLTAADNDELDRRLAESRRQFPLPPAAIRPATGPVLVSIADLAGFLKEPAKAALARRLNLRDEPELEWEDDEPFAASWRSSNDLVHTALGEFVTASLRLGVDEALATWPRSFDQTYAGWRRECRLPEGAFGQADHGRFVRLLKPRVAAEGGLASLLRQLTAAEFCGPAVLGSENRPVAGEQTRFDVLRLSVAQVHAAGHEVHVHGVLPFLWRSKDAVDVLILPWYMKAEPSASRLTRDFFEPLLFLLALKAQGSGWLGRRKWRIHVLGKDGVVTLESPASHTSTAAARDYLSALVADFLDPGCFDTLPFALIEKDQKGVLELPFTYAGDEALRDAWRNDADDKALATWRSRWPRLDPEDARFPDEVRKTYQRVFQDELEDDQEGQHPAYRPDEVVQLASPAVPEDAFDKLRRRFAILAPRAAAAAAGDKMSEPKPRIRGAV
jgi:hypothetical protein